MRTGLKKALYFIGFLTYLAVGVGVVAAAARWMTDGPPLRIIGGDDYRSYAALAVAFAIPSILLSVGYWVVHLFNRHNSQLEASTDALTGLFNRRHLSRVLPVLIRDHNQKKSDLSVIMLDIDSFKLYNDNYGHQQGDVVLAETAKAVLSVLRRNADIVCRYGGEEFIILLPNTHAEGALIVAEKIHNAVIGLNIPHAHSPAAPYVTVSQGIYTDVPAGVSREVEHLFVERADKALYHAKQTGKNRYQSWAAM